MQKYNQISYIALPFAFVLLSLILGCNKDPSSSEDDKTATFTIVTNNTLGQFEAKVEGNGGSAIDSALWYNESGRADFYVDKTSMTTGSLKFELLDANENSMVKRTLDSSPPDTVSALSPGGTRGLWTVKVTMTDFSGSATIKCNRD